MSFDLKFATVGDIDARLDPVARLKADIGTEEQVVSAFQSGETIDAQFKDEAFTAEMGTMWARGIDPSGTTAQVGDVKDGKKFYLADGTFATGTLLWDWMGEDAECIDNNVHSFSDTLNNTDWGDWTPSTTAGLLVASVNKTARAIDTGNYDYLLRWRFCADVAYASGTTMKAVPIKQAIEIWQAIIKRPSSYANLQIPTFTANACITMFTAPVYDYYNTSGTHTMTYTASYGFYPTVVAATFSNSTTNTPNLTIKTPNIYAKCNNTYFVSTRAGEIDTANTTLKMKGELWRMKHRNTVEALYASVVDLYNNPLS